MRNPRRPVVTLVPSVTGCCAGGTKFRRRVVTILAVSGNAPPSHCNTQTVYAAPRTQDFLVKSSRFRVSIRWFSRLKRFWTRTEVFVSVKSSGQAHMLPEKRLQPCMSSHSPGVPPSLITRLRLQSGVGIQT